MSMGHVLPRFRHKHGMILSRSVAADRPLESYCIGHDLAAMAAPRCSVMRRSGVYRAGPVGGAGPGQYAVRYQKRPEGLAAPHSTAATECVASGLHWMAGRMIWGRMMWRIRNREGSKWGGEIRHRADEPVYIMTPVRNNSGINKAEHAGRMDACAVPGVSPEAVPRC